MKPIAIAAFLIATLAAPAQAETAVRVTDLMPDVLSFQQKAKGLPPDAQVRLFRQLIVARHPEVFQPQIVPLSGADYDAALNRRIAEILADLPKREARMQKAHDILAANLPNYLAAFHAKFPDLGAPVPVYLTLSLDSFTGEQRPVNGAFTLLLGLDSIAASGVPLDSAHLAPLVEHELFHLYHFRKIDPFRTVATAQGMPLWFWIWAEGFATYAERVLNPALSERQILLSPVDMRGMLKPHMPHLTRRLLGEMDSTDGTLYAEFLSGDPADAAKLHKGLPARSGYFIGYEIVADAARTRSLAQLSSLTGPELEALVRAELRKLAKVS